MEKYNTIWVNGCFDLIHIGHIRMLEFAKSLGVRLIVGIDTDERVSESKGPDRPVNTQNIRREMLLSIKYVDSVVTFNSADSLKDEIIKSKAEVIVVGEEYRERGVIGSDILPVVYFDRINGYSSTSILENTKDWNI
jgi:rfaE bifunctional protein nucleotidyltransferase chain/domain